MPLSILLLALPTDTLVPYRTHVALLELATDVCILHCALGSTHGNRVAVLPPAVKSLMVQNRDEKNKPLAKTPNSAKLIILRADERARQRGADTAHTS